MDPAPTTEPGPRVLERLRVTPRAAGWLVALVILGVGLERYERTVERLYPTDVIDDAYITYRYAENWAAGHGPTWNPGEPPVEGYSAPLWMTMLAGASVMGADLPTTGKRLSLLSSVALLVMLGVIVWRSGAGPPWALIAVGAFAAMPNVAVWSVGGMETALYALLVLASAWTTLEAARAPERRPWWIATAVLLSLVVLSRTEGVLVVPAFLVALWLGNDRGGVRRRALLVATVPVAVVAAHLGARRLYYGEWLPAPALAKSEPFVGQPLFDRFFGEHWPYLALAALAVLFVREPWRQRGLRYALVVTALLCMVVVNVSPWMGKHGRYLLPAVPLLLFAAAVGASEVLRRAREPVLAVALLGLVFVMQGEKPLGGSRADTVHRVERYSNGLAHSHIALGRWLDEHFDGDPLLVAADCGVIPYYSGMRVVDLYGLNDAHIARGGVDPDYVFGKRPELIVLTTQGLHGAIRNDPRFRDGYRKVRHWEGLYRVSLHCRKDYCAQRRDDRGGEEHAAATPGR